MTPLMVNGDVAAAIVVWIGVGVCFTWAAIGKWWNR